MSRETTKVGWWPRFFFAARSTRDRGLLRWVFKAVCYECRRFACFVQTNHKAQWQRELANTYTLSTAMILAFITLALIIVLLTTGSVFASRGLPFFAAGSLLGTGLYIYNQHSPKVFIGLYLIGFYLLLAFSIVCSVGIGAVSMVLCCWAIILAGTLCGYWCALVPTVVSTIFFLAYRTAELQNWTHPAYIMSQKPNDFSTVILLALLFYILAAVSGSLFRLEENRRRLQEAEESFVQQKSLLTNKIKRQTQKLRSAESDKMRQLYRLAEAGEVSAALIHDLANSLTLLTLEVDSIESAGNHAAVRRAKSQIKQINYALNRTRQQLRGEYRPTKTFDITKGIGSTVKTLQAAAKRSGVRLEWRAPQEDKFMCLGEEALFRQFLTNVINNAIESYEHMPADTKLDRRVVVELTTHGSGSHISIIDWGVGISPDIAEKIFEPFYTTKEGGMGMGMYLTRRFIESNFGGTIELKDVEHRTCFEVILPKLIR